MSTQATDELHAKLIEFLGHKYPIATYEGYADWLAAHDQGSMYLRQAIEALASRLIKTDGGHAQLEDGFEYLESILRKARAKAFSELHEKRVHCDAVESALREYHHALDTRQHAGVAADKMVKSVESALGKPWKQGATLQPEISESQP
jgi:hypothetical protein